MPYQRPGNGKYVTNASGGAINHGAPVLVSNYVGVAVKQKAPAVTDALATHKQIANGEDFFLITKGEVQVANTGIAAAVKGDAIYIVPATNALTTTATANTKFGRVAEVAGKRGVPTGKVRIDLDAKDSI